MLECTYIDDEAPYFLRWPCYGCGCLTVPVAKHLLDANDQRALTTFHPCQVCGHKVQLPWLPGEEHWWELRERAIRNRPALDDAPSRKPWPDELPGLADERLSYGIFGDWRDRVRRVPL